MSGSELKVWLTHRCMTNLSTGAAGEPEGCNNASAAGRKADKESSLANPADSGAMGGPVLASNNPYGSRRTEPEQQSSESEIDVVTAIQKTHRECARQEECRRGGDTEGLSLTPSLAGREKLFQEVLGHDIAKAELVIVCEAYALWFAQKYLPRLRDIEKAKGENASYIPKPIHSPLALFALELDPYLDEAREFRALHERELATRPDWHKKGDADCRFCREMHGGAAA
ncbi:MAG: hypothetical protein ACRD40_12200 [Candidatus Acidiferrales bacterium]